MSSTCKKKICDTPDNNISIMIHGRNTLLFNNGEPWVKKDNDEDFDVPMGCYDGEEICELIGTYLLYQINNVISKENIGLYRDDGLTKFKNISGPEAERKKKDRIRILKVMGCLLWLKQT